MDEPEVFLGSGRVRDNSWADCHLMAMVHGITDHYGVLDVPPEADEATVKKAYRKLVLLWHPDKHNSDRVAAEDKIRQINDAYETLGNPFKRSTYDQQLLALERKARGLH